MVLIDSRQIPVSSGQFLGLIADFIDCTIRKYYLDVIERYENSMFL